MSSLKGSMEKPSILSYVFFVSLFFISALLAYPVSAHAGEDPGVRSIEAKGFATITGADTAGAREAAVQDALMKAVEEAVATIAAPEAIAENYEALSEKVYTKTLGYIKEYKITGEALTGGLVSVTVKAMVAAGELADDLDALGLVHAPSERPRVLFMIAEQNIGRKFFTYWWWWWGGKREIEAERIELSAAETALKERFLAKGFNVVDISVATGGFEVPEAYRIVDLTKDQAIYFGRNLDAEIVVMGKAIAQKGPKTEGSRLGVYLADISAQAVQVDTGKVLGSTRGHGTSRHVSEVTGATTAMDNAAAEAAEKLTAQILSDWAGPNLVTIRLLGVTDYRQVTDFKGMLKERVSGIGNIYERGFEATRATIQVESRVPARVIADEIAGSGKPALKVINTTSGTIDAVLE